MPLTTEVIIVGAGPTGLSLAAQLVRYGIDFQVIEKNDGVTPFSKAIGVHARTLEIYEQMDLAQRAVSEGAIAGRGRLLVNGEVQAEIDLSNLGEGLSTYPYMLLLEQSKNEKLLYDYVTSHGRDVQWQTELTDFSQTNTSVTAQYKTATGNVETVEGKFLVGCDGAKSLVRHNLGLTFSGSTFERIFYVADCQVDWKFSHDAVHICLSKDTLLLFFPLKGEKRYRIVGTFPEQYSKEEGDILYEEIEAEIKEHAKLELDIHDVQWFSTYKVHTRHVSSFSLGRCYLAGDAAHIHSPAGAQGMNTGIQDAYNLAWKIAMQLRRGAADSLLRSYNEERLENAKNLLETTDRLFQFGAGDEWPLAFLRTNVFPSVARFILSIDAIKKFIFPRLSQIGINYRHSSLSQHTDDEHFAVKAGDRMPYVLIDGTSIYDRLREPKFHVVLFEKTNGEFQQLAEEMKNARPDLVDVNTIAPSAPIGEVFETEKSFGVLLRPDNYIGLISPEISLEKVNSYLRQTAALPE